MPIVVAALAKHTLLYFITPWPSFWTVHMIWYGGAHRQKLETLAKGKGKEGINSGKPTVRKHKKRAAKK